MISMERSKETEQAAQRIEVDNIHIKMILVS